MRKDGARCCGLPRCYDASLISSRARFSAFFASVRKLASGFSTRIALLRSMALSFDGAAHDLTSPTGFAPVTSHFRQLNLILRLADVKRGHAIVQTLESRASILQAG